MEWLTPGLLTVVALIVVLGTLWLTKQNRDRITKIEGEGGHAPVPPPTDVKAAAQLNVQAAEKQHDAALKQKEAAADQKEAAKANASAAHSIAVTAKEQAKDS